MILQNIFCQIILLLNAEPQIVLIVKKAKKAGNVFILIKILASTLINYNLNEYLLYFSHNFLYIQLYISFFQNKSGIIELAFRNVTRDFFFLIDIFL